MDAPLDLLLISRLLSAPPQVTKPRPHPGNVKSGRSEKLSTPGWEIPVSAE
jgi:hypothetical protein